MQQNGNYGFQETGRNEVIMIKKQEIMDLAWEFTLDPNTVEKDYVLGWLLAGIQNHPILSENLIFKGGTCLKKCYFETFRFSEDLDFTLIEQSYVNEALLRDCFQKVSEWLMDSVGIEIPEGTIEFKRYTSRTGREAIKGSVGYIGPMQRRRDPVRIKLDLTADEILVTEPQIQTVHHPYTDNPAEKIKAYSYSFHELFAEKIRAMSERARPRDLYDVISIYRHLHSGDSSQAVFNILQKKCEYKAIPVPTLMLLEAHPKLAELGSEWGNMLGHQLPNLPDKESFWEDLPKLFEWMRGEKSKTSLMPIRLPDNIDSNWQLPRMIQPWQMHVPIELVRYAGANHLCIEIYYEENKQLIEPYDLKKTIEGLFLLMAAEHDSGKVREYFIDKIKSLEITQKKFCPRFVIGLISKLAV